MIFKPRDKKLDVSSLDVLYKRLILNHPIRDKVLSEWKIKKAEVGGEREVDYPLRFLDEKKYLILHNLRLADKYGFFQMDTLLIYESFILILEVKNWQGTVEFGKNDQVTRRLNNIEEGFKNPVLQAKMQRHRLQKWLHRQGFPNLMIDFLVVFSFPKTIITTSSPEISIPKKVIHNSALFFNIQDIQKKVEQSRVNMSMGQLIDMASRLKNAHNPPSNHILQRFGLDGNALVKGVFCPKCGEIPMIRDKQKWYCKGCGDYSVDAHLGALYDYAILYGDRITNKQARVFLQVHSPHVVRRLLIKAGFRSFGSTSSRTYIINLVNRGT